jgi:hypothetical protein
MAFKARRIFNRLARWLGPLQVFIQKTRWIAAVTRAFLSLAVCAITALYRDDRPFQKTLSFGNAYGVLAL